MIRWPAAARAVMVVAAALLMLLATPAPHALAGQEVVFDAGGHAPGTVIVRTGERRLYFVLGAGRAMRYAVAVGRPGRQWTGSAQIDGKHLRPHWAPPAAIKRDRPGTPDIVLSGSPNNPMGAAALTLSGGEYAIHGTNRPDLIGGSVSYGCIRMVNDDILDLFERVVVGTQVVVTR